MISICKQEGWNHTSELSRRELCFCSGVATEAEPVATVVLGIMASRETMNLSGCECFEISISTFFLHQQNSRSGLLSPRCSRFKRRPFRCRVLFIICLMCPRVERVEGGDSGFLRRKKLAQRISLCVGGRVGGQEYFDS